MRRNHALRRPRPLRVRTGQLLFGHHLHEEALPFSDPFDFDGHDFHEMLETLQSIVVSRRGDLSTPRTSEGVRPGDRYRRRNREHSDANEGKPITGIDDHSRYL